VRVWDPETGQEAPPIRTGVPRHRPAFGRDGNRLACLSSEDRVRLWDTATGDWRALDGTVARPTAVGFSPDGWWVVAGGEAGAVLAWDTRKADGKPVTLSSGGEPAHRDGVESVTFDPKGRYLATLGKDGVAKLWEVERWAPRRTLTADTALKALAFDPDGKRVLAGGADGSVRAWDTDTDADPRKWRTNHGPIARLVRGPKDNHLVVIDTAGVATLRDANSTMAGGGETKLDQHAGRVNAAAFNPAGDLLATGGDDKAVLLWHMFFKKPRARLLGHEAAVVAVGFGPDGKRLATGDAKGTVIVWSVPEIKPGLGEPDEVR
jgi:WD40 repeat protein